MTSRDWYSLQASIFTAKFSLQSYKTHIYGQLRFLPNLRSLFLYFHSAGVNPDLQVLHHLGVTYSRSNIIKKNYKMSLNILALYSYIRIQTYIFQGQVSQFKDIRVKIQARYNSFKYKLSWIMINIYNQFNRRVNISLSYPLIVP